MRQYSKGGMIWLMAIPMLFLPALTACSGPKQTVVLNEAKTAKLKQGEPAPFEGWLFTDSAAATLLEAAERCNNK